MKRNAKGKPGPTVRRTSRLRTAWLALGFGILALIVAAVLAPAPRSANEPFEIALPDTPDRYAQSAGRAPDAEEPAGDEASGAPLPRVVLGEEASPAEPDDGEVVITLGGPAPGIEGVRRRPPAVPPRAFDPALTRETPNGLRPTVGADGRTPFSTYRRLRPLGDARGVAVVVAGLGLDDALTDRAIALPADVSLSFAPYAKDLPTLIERARAAGHEVLIELPMGTPGVAPAALGPAGLLAERTPAANAKRLQWLLTRAPAYPMVTNYLGRGLSGDEAAMARIMRDVSELGVAYVDDTGLAAGAARIAGVPYAKTTVLIEPDAMDVSGQLSAVAKRAAAGEVTLAKIYATEEGLRVLARWADGLPGDIALVPASSAVSAS